MSLGRDAAGPLAHVEGAAINSYLTSLRRSLVGLLVVATGIMGLALVQPGPAGAVAPAVGAIAGVAPAVAPLPSVDLDALDPDPVPSWGVVGTGATVTEPKPYVWDFAEIGDRIYVAGTFTGVQRYGFDPTSQVVPQAYLAAFDRDSGEWIATFRPTLDRTVYALAVSPNGNLLVGGEFTTVNGQARTGLVMLDPTTGATVASFPTVIAALNAPAIVRELVVDGADVYAAGEFDFVNDAGTDRWVYNAARLRADSGVLDTGWLPRFAGSVWDLAIDGGRGRVHAVGFFTSANASPATNRFATVTQGTGETVPGLPQLEFNDTVQLDTVAVAFAGDRIYVAGAQHVVQVLDPVANQRLAYSTTGLTCDTFAVTGCSYVAGGDFQVLEVAGDTVLAGCHCYRSVEGNFNSPDWDGRTHYSSVSGARTDNRIAIGYTANTGAVASDFVPGLAPDFYGTWALHVDGRGCLYVGGYFNRTAAGDWIGGFGKFCAPTAAPVGLAGVSANQTVRLDWTAPSSQLPVQGYKVYRDGTFLGDTAGLTYTDGGLVAGAVHTYEVRTADSAGRLSDPAEVTVTVAGADATPPEPPGDLGAAVDGTDVTLGWSAAVDDQGIREYLVHRDYQFIAVLPPNQLTFTDQGVANGPHRYDVRARDLAGNLSEPSTVTAAVGAPDTEAPTVPANVVGEVDGTAVTLTWDASSDLPDPGGSGIAGYLVHDNYRFLAWVPTGTSYVHVGAASGPHRYQVRAQDRAGNNSAPAEVSVTVGAPDTEAPTVPANVVGEVDGTAVTLTWDASSDLPDPGGSGIAGYLVHRDYQFLAWVPTGTTFSENGRPPGTYRYEIRAQDRAGNNSAPSSPAIVAVG